MASICLLCGFGVALGWLWGGFGVALGWLWGGFGVALGWLWGGFGLPLGCLWGGFEMVLGGFAGPFCPLPSPICFSQAPSRQTSASRAPSKPQKSNKVNSFGN